MKRRNMFGKVLCPECGAPRGYPHAGHPLSSCSFAPGGANSHLDRNASKARHERQQKAREEMDAKNAASLVITREKRAERQRKLLEMQAVSS